MENRLQIHIEKQSESKKKNFLKPQFMLMRNQAIQNNDLSEENKVQQDPSEQDLIYFSSLSFFNVKFQNTLTSLTLVEFRSRHLYDLAYIIFI